MATSEHTDEVTIAAGASVAHSQGQHSLENAGEPGASISVLDTSDTTSPKRKRLSTSETLVNISSPNLKKDEEHSENTTQYTPHQQPPKDPIIPYSESMPSVVQGTESIVTTSEHSSSPGTSFHSNVSTPEDTASHQPTPPEINGEPANILSSAVFNGSSEQSSQKGLLKDIFLEFSSPRHFNAELTLGIMQGDNFETLRLMKISPTKWKAVKNIHLDAGDMMLIVQSKDGGDEAFLTLSADEIYAMTYAEEDTPAEHVFTSVKEDNPIGVRMTSAVSSSSPLGSDEMKAAMGLAIIQEMTTAQAFQRNFEETGHVNDITRVISHCENAISLTSSGFGFDLPPLTYAVLGNAYLSRFALIGKLQDIDHAISHHQKAVQSTPSGDTELPGRLNNLGNSYLRRFEYIGDLQDIEHAIFHYQKAIKSTPSGHADLLALFSNLGNSYSCRFERTGNLQDIDCAISHHQKIVESTPSGHVDLPIRFGNLGTSYSRRFQRFGNLQDIDYAISHHQKAVECAPGHTQLPTGFNNLGNSYLHRFERTRDLQDVDRAILYHQKAVESTPSGHLSCLASARQINNLGNSYAARFNFTHDLQDIDHAIFHHQKAVQFTPSGHADLPRWFHNLGTSYSDRFICSKNLQDIDHAISYKHKAVQSTPSGHTQLPAGLNNLGTSYIDRFERTHDLQDIDRAIFYYQKAVESTPSDHAELPGRLSNLGGSYRHRFDMTDSLPDVQNSIASYRQAAEANGAPSIRLKSAEKAAMLSSVHDHSRCLTDFALAISLLSEVAGLEQTIYRRHANLQGHSDLVGSAVAAALRFGGPNRALEWLEQGRCLVWNQLNQLRTPIDNLRIKNLSLANRFIKVATALESYGSRNGSPLSLPPQPDTLVEAIRRQDDTLDHTLRATEYKQLLEEIRALPDFHDFLQPPKATDILSSLPNNGPLVIFNIHKTRCDALAIMAGIEEPLHILLENFSLAQAEELQATLRLDLLKQREVEDQDRMPRRVRPNPSSMLSVLTELWCKVVQPILEALGYSLNPSDRRRIWWCPTGPLAFLPLHAAGIYGSAYNPGSCVSDFVVSSYTPTVRSLKDKSNGSSTSSKCTGVLLISQPNTPGLSSIPSTRKETHDLEALMKTTAIEALLLEDSKATIENVKAEMKSRSWVHFACHGVQDVNQPLSSGLCLHDGRLELLEIMKQKNPNLDLVFLSACQTSKGDLELSEEVVHLTAGMLGAGCRGVVGTMWSISDLHGPKFAQEFYQYLLKEKGSEGLDSTRAAYALDYATRKVREIMGDDDLAFLTWVPYVHFGY